MPLFFFPENTNLYLSPRNFRSERNVPFRFLASKRKNHRSQGPKSLQFQPVLIRRVQLSDWLATRWNWILCAIPCGHRSSAVDQSHHIRISITINSKYNPFLKSHWRNGRIGDTSRDLKRNSSNYGGILFSLADLILSVEGMGISVVIFFKNIVKNEKKTHRILISYKMDFEYFVQKHWKKKLKINMNI